MSLLLLSNSRVAGTGYLEFAFPWLTEALSGVKKVAFVPYAAVGISFDEYEAAVAAAFENLGIEIISVHRHDSPAGVLLDCDAVAVGGGNTFCLVDALQRHGLIEAIRTSISAGKPYTGWSAGANVACPTISTTNDMPILQPGSFEAIGAVPYQINPHYLDAHPDRHMGETREQRILEFLRVNPDKKVVGLREGTALLVTQGSSTLLGKKSARIFEGSAPPFELEPGADLDFLHQ